MSHDLASLIQGWDGHAVILRHDEPTGSWIFIAIHNPFLGQPSGGTRMRSYPTPADGLLDAMRLAEGMTHKWAALGLDWGGGKAVLAIPGPLGERDRHGLLQRYGHLLESLQGAFSTGVDLGTTAADMLVLAQTTRWVHGIDRQRNESIDPGPFTARGVFAGLKAAVAHVFGGEELQGRGVLVQGVGGVGGPLARLLQTAGARLLVSDVDGERASRWAADLGGEVVPAEAVFEAPCDVFAPCAVGAVLNPRTIPSLRCRLVAGSANNQLEDTRRDAAALQARGIVYAPDYVINAGGAAALGMMSRGVRDRDAIVARVDAIGVTVGEILAEAAARGESPVDAARRRVERVLAGLHPDAVEATTP